MMSGTSKGLHPLTTQTTPSRMLNVSAKNIQFKGAGFSHLFQSVIWPDCLDSRVGLLDSLLACECDRIGGAGFRLQSTWKEPAATNGRGEHTGNDVCVVGVTHDLSMPQMSCPDVSPPPSHSHCLCLTFITFSLTLFFSSSRFFQHTLSFYIWQCLFLAIANYTGRSKSLSDIQEWWFKPSVTIRNAIFLTSCFLFNKKHRIHVSEYIFTKNSIKRMEITAH